MKALIGNAILIGLAVATASVVGCSTGAGLSAPGATTPGATDDSTGKVGLQLTIAGGETINTVSYSITGGPTVVSGTINVTNSNTVSALVGGIAPGTYTVTLTATSVDGTVTCLGTATNVVVVARATAIANINLICQSADAGNANGSILINGTVQLCPTWQSIATSVSETTIGKTATLSFGATGPNASGLTYTAVATGGAGTLASLAGSTPNNGTTSDVFTCTGVGTETIQLTFADGDSGVCTAANTTPPAITIVCDAFVGYDAGPDTGLPDTGPADTGPADTGPADTGPADTGPADTGPSADACTTYKVANAAANFSLSTPCTSTEEFLFSKDTTGAFLGSLFQDGCIDDNQGGANNECDDLTAASDKTECLNTLSCDLGGATFATSPGFGNVLNAYCGTLNASQCTASATAPAGACASEWNAGYPFSPVNPSLVLSNIAHKPYPSGYANGIVGCANTNAATF